MIDTTIHIGNIFIHEPVTVLTDFIIAMIAFTFFKNLIANSEALKNWRLFFLFISLSSFIGGCSHAFFEMHTGVLYKTIWITMQLMNGAALFFAQQAMLLSVLRDSVNYNAWKLSFKIQLFLYFVTLIAVQQYYVTIIENAIGFIPIMIIHLLEKKKIDNCIMISMGILISFITAIVHTTKYSLSAYFNYNDIAHVFIMISLTVMFLGIQKLANNEDLVFASVLKAK